MISKSDFKKINDYLWEIPRSFRSDMRVPARIYASEKILEDIFRDRSIPQLIDGTTMPGIVKYAIAMPDCHEGYSVPIGFVGAIRTSDGVISPGACGFDINCGMRILKSNCTQQEVKSYLDKIATGIQIRIPSGLGRGRKTKLSIGQIDKILEGGVPFLVKKGYGTVEDVENCEAEGRLEQADALVISDKAKNRGRGQVGTLGSGNHFIEIQKVEEIFDERVANVFGLFKNQVVVMIHTGSRGLGHQVCTDYLRTMIPAMYRYKIKMPDREFACVPFNSPEGQRYFSAMAGAANYAWANRQMISFYVREAWKNILGQKEELELLYDVAHNIIKREKHLIDGKETDVIVHRKGSTRAFPPQHPDIPERYKEVGQPVIIPGTMGTASYVLVGTEKSREAWYTVNHGAGRTMSRGAARRRFSGHQVIQDLEAKGIIIKYQNPRGIVEEAPMAYKDINSVVEIADKAGLAKKVAKLVPLAVIKGE